MSTPSGKIQNGKGLLYAGTELGVFVSFDGGAHWQPLQLNLPPSPIHDLVVKDDDLVVGTHGRSFWVLDDLTPLRQVNAPIGQVGYDSVSTRKPLSACITRRSSTGANRSATILPPEPSLITTSRPHRRKRSRLDIFDSRGNSFAISPARKKSEGRTTAGMARPGGDAQDHSGQPGNEPVRLGSAI